MYRSGQTGQTVNLLPSGFASSNLAAPTNAGVVELVVTLVLGTSAERRGGSSPFTRTICQSDGIGSHEGLKIPWVVMPVQVRVLSLVLKNTMPSGVIGNTSDFGSEESTFESWLGNFFHERIKRQILLTASFDE